MKKFLILVLCLCHLSAYPAEEFFTKVKESAAFLQEKIGTKPKLLVVLTAGIEGPQNLLEEKVEISSSKIPHFPIARAAGHEGKLIFGKLDGVDVVLLKGRYHFYEGITAQEVVFPYFVLNALGVESVITMNAVGGIREDLEVGDIMLIEDHINFLSDNPLKGVSIFCEGRQFTDMTTAYDADLKEIARRNAAALDIGLKHGIYAAMSGPNYETKAEIGMLRAIGADFVGMSTVFEVIASRFLNMRVLSFSCITNPAADRHVGKMKHEDVLAALDAMGPKLTKLVNACAKEIVSK